MPLLPYQKTILQLNNSPLRLAKQEKIRQIKKLIEEIYWMLVAEPFPITSTIGARESTVNLSMVLRIMRFNRVVVFSA
jgi:hypothetical protein